MPYEEKLAEYKTRVSNPEVTLEHDGHGFPEGAREAAFLDWLCCLTAHGDDGRQYWIECNPMSLTFNVADLWVMGVGWEKGRVVQLPGSTHKIADFPVVAVDRHIHPGGSLTTKRSEHEVSVDLPDFHLVCRDDKTWHYSIEDKEKGIKAEWIHSPTGYPTWYGKEKPLVLTPHSITYGYNWSGRVEGELTIEGQKVRIKGAGVRERYWAVDTCPAEIGGWEDWMWFHFDEMFGSMFEFKFNKTKDMSLNIIEGNQFFPVGDLSIEHFDWAYLRPLGFFIPTRYIVTVKTEAGVLEMAANVVGCKLWGMSGEVPDSPVLTLNWDKVDGIFTYPDGRKRTLTNGLGGTVIRQWKPYPDPYANIFTPQADEQLKPYEDRVLLFE